MTHELLYLANDRAKTLKMTSTTTYSHTMQSKKAKQFYKLFKRDLYLVAIVLVI